MNIDEQASQKTVSYINKLVNVYGGDTEMCRIYAVTAMCNLLNRLGYEEVVDAYYKADHAFDTDE